MIFEGYENYITERTINLTQYIGDQGNEGDFHKNFFKDISGNAWANTTVKSLLLFFKSENEEENGLIDQLLRDDISHVLLIIPQKFINNIISEKRQTSKERIRPKEFTKKFIEKFSNEFTSNEIGCSILVSGSRHKKDTETLEKWLNLRELQKSLQLNSDEAYLLSFRDMKIDTNSNKNAISLELNGKYLTIKESCSVLLGSSRLFKFNTSTPESIIKITNNSNDDYIDFITENIEMIKSSSSDLHDEYLDDEVFEDFGLNAKELKNDDVEINFDKTSIILSNRIPTPKIEKEKVQTKTTSSVKKEELSTIITPSTIGTDTDDESSKINMNLKRDYLVALNRFVTAYENGLKEVHYHLVKNSGKLILVGGRKSDKKEQAIASVVANLNDSTFSVTNLSSQPMSFKIGDKKVEYQLKKSSLRVTPNTIDTDEPETATEPSIITIKPKESHQFNKRVELLNSAIEFSDNGIEVEYIDFLIGSFNNKLEFNRHYFRHFGLGNIIDNQENFDYAGRIYEDGKKNILGSAISRNPMLLTLRNSTFTISNQIKEAYTIITQTATKESEISYREEESFSKDELLSKPNYISITKDGISLVEISIRAN